ncbi:Carboxyl/Cholinesterase 10 [Frankliniella occidentalis]|nr:Carboxyl/Cholinesterase 10 [Frankliniella occidentalis]
MLDQVQALRWVQENIVYFGGNKQSITLAGFSAGAASVLMHTLSPLSKGLFHKAVAMSGSPLNPWAVQPAAAAKAKRLAEMVGCTGADTAALVSCLQASSATVLVALQSQFQDHQYVFEESWSGVMQTATDLDMRRQLIELWVSFAKNSIPVLSGGNWTPLSKVRSDVLQFLDVYGPGNVTMVHTKDFGQTAFWSSLQCKTNGTNSARSAASLLLFIGGFIVLVFKTG